MNGANEWKPLELSAEIMRSKDFQKGRSMAASVAEGDLPRYSRAFSIGWHVARANGGEKRVPYTEGEIYQAFF